MEVAIIDNPADIEQLLSNPVINFSKLRFDIKTSVFLQETLHNCIDLLLFGVFTGILLQIFWGDHGYHIFDVSIWREACLVLRQRILNWFHIGLDGLAALILSISYLFLLFLFFLFKIHHTFLESLHSLQIFLIILFFDPNLTHYIKLIIVLHAVLRPSIWVDTTRTTWPLICYSRSYIWLQFAEPWIPKLMASRFNVRSVNSIKAFDLGDHAIRTELALKVVMWAVDVSATSYAGRADAPLRSTIWVERSPHNFIVVNSAAAMRSCTLNLILKHRANRISRVQGSSLGNQVHLLSMIVVLRLIPPLFNEIL